MHKNNFYPQNLTKPKPTYSKECLEMPPTSQASSSLYPELNRNCVGVISPALVWWQPWDRSPVPPVLELYQSSPKAAEGCGRVNPNLTNSSLLEVNWGAGSWQHQEHWMQSFCIQKLPFLQFVWKLEAGWKESKFLYLQCNLWCQWWRLWLVTEATQVLSVSFHERS